MIKTKKLSEVFVCVVYVCFIVQKARGTKEHWKHILRKRAHDDGSVRADIECIISPGTYGVIPHVLLPHPSALCFCIPFNESRVWYRYPFYRHVRKVTKMAFTLLLLHLPIFFPIQ